MRTQIIQQLKNAPPTLKDVRHPMDREVVTSVLFTLADLHPQEAVELDLLTFETLFLVRARGFRSRILLEEMQRPLEENAKFAHSPVRRIYMDVDGYWLTCEVDKIDYAGRSAQQTVAVPARTHVAAAASASKRRYEDDDDADDVIPATPYGREKKQGYGVARGRERGRGRSRSRSRSPSPPPVPRYERGNGGSGGGGFFSGISSLFVKDEPRRRY